MRYSRRSISQRTLAFTSALLLCLCAAYAFAQTAAPAPPTELNQRLDAILARAGVARGFWGIEIEDLDSGRILYSRDADRLFAPASNAKLFTTAATLALLGTGYRIQTTVESSAPPDSSGRIGGDLVLVGRGDANLSGRALPFAIKTERPFPPTRVLDELADQLVARGIKAVEGDIVGDDSFFADEPYGEGWSQEDVVSLWGAPVSALAINDNVVFLNIAPAARPGEPAFFSLSPFAEYYRIDNRVLTTPAGSARNISIRHRPGSHHLELRGTIPLDDPGYGEALAVDDPAHWSALLLRDALARRGIVVYGRVRARHLEPGPPSPAGTSFAPQPPVVLAAHLSSPLALDIVVTNKVSQNLHAEMLLRLLGREKGSSGSVAGGLQVLRGFLALAGIAPEEYAFYDACGLSRQDLVSPRATTKLLRYATRQNWGAGFIDSLPLAGVDGTLASRLQTLPAGAVLHAKTGSLEHVNVLAGYLTTAAGQHLVFSLMANNFNLAGKQAAAVLDEIVTEAERSRN
jgi:serine-type D-Ala-D-Ala carboxypeptidase/endopeptidase (penicillin-binding protein 4)